MHDNIKKKGKSAGMITADREDKGREFQGSEGHRTSFMLIRGNYHTCLSNKKKVEGKQNEHAQIDVATH